MDTHVFLTEDIHAEIKMHLHCILLNQKLFMDNYNLQKLAQNKRIYDIPHTGKICITI